MKKYVLTVSQTFPATHKRKGEPTYFIDSLISGFIGHKNYTLCRSEKDGGNIVLPSKIHTIRSNYELWSKRIKEVQDGIAILSIRTWYGKPYKSKQVEFCQLDKNSGIGVQKLLCDDYLYSCQIDDIKRRSFIIDNIPAHDGLSHDDFEEWFRKYDLSKPMAIIQFTKFRY